MTIEEMLAVMSEVDFPGYEFFVKASSHGFIYLQAGYYEPDVLTPSSVRVWQVTRRWALSPEMTKSEIVATAFKCVLTSMEHKTREWFTYRKRAIYQPHYDVDALHAICEQREATRTRSCRRWRWSAWWSIPLTGWGATMATNPVIRWRAFAGQ